MKLEISVDGQRYEVEVEVAEEDDSSRAQDNRPAPATATIQSTVLRTPPKPGASADPNCAAVQWRESWCASRSSRVSRSRLTI